MVWKSKLLTGKLPDIITKPILQPTKQSHEYMLHLLQYMLHTLHI